VSIRMMRSAWCMEIRRIDEAFVPSRNLVLKSVELEASLGELKRFPCANHSCARMHPKKPASDREKKNTRPYWQLLQTADRLCCGTVIAYTHTQTLLVSRENARRAPRLLRRGAALAPKIQDLCALLYDRNKCKYTIRICTMVGSAPLGDVLDRRASICRGYAL
jgi:hypothetical protein